MRYRSSNTTILGILLIIIILAFGCNEESLTDEEIMEIHDREFAEKYGGEAEPEDSSGTPNDSL